MAWLYDALVITALLLVATLIATLISGGEAAPWLTRLFVAGSTVGYFSFSWARGGQTAGMRAWRLRVVTADGYPLTYERTFKRLFACIATLAPVLLPLLLAVFSKTKQSVYDTLSNTRVVLEPPRE